MNDKGETEMDEMDEMEFLAHWCEPLTPEQAHMARYFIKRGGFLGVGRAVGSPLIWPLVTRNGKQAEVIDRAGYSQLASVEGRKGYAPHERTNKEG